MLRFAGSAPSRTIPQLLLTNHIPSSSRLINRTNRPAKLFIRFATENGDKLNPDDSVPKEGGRGLNNNGESGGNGGEEESKGGQPRLSLKWVELILDPDPDNVVAVGLTGLLTWASVQILWQLFVISLAIVLAALKYSFVAAILLFILVTLL